MKKTINSMLAVVFTLFFIVSFSSCSDNPDIPSVWKNAIYLEDTELGEGAKTIKIEVKAEDRSVTLTIHTDTYDILEALKENNLIEGKYRDSRFVATSINGISADIETDKSYWALWVNGNDFFPGVGAPITDGGYYLLVYTK